MLFFYLLVSSGTTSQPHSGPEGTSHEWKAANRKRLLEQLKTHALAQMHEEYDYEGYV